MNIRQLELFMTVAEVENMTEAANRSFISQPAVSQTIHELEEEIGVRLFDRPGRAIELNPAGKAFYQRVKHFLQEYQELEDFAEYLEKQAPMKLGANLTIANFWLPEIIPPFLQQGHQVEILADTAERILQALRNQELDLALLEGTVGEKDLIVEPFDQYELMVVVAVDHPLAQNETVTVEEFLHYPLFLREKGSAIRDTLDSWLQLQQKQASPTMSSINSPALLAMTATGTGITFLPERLAQESIYRERVCCLPFEDQRLYNQIQLVYQPKHLFTATMKAFRERIHLIKKGEK
ncbi:LysR family transcriptional regulator [Enterococcus sp. 669A]|uniref:LysR family transcriptional regulator n=1 Tax=Candidatus Enterococcus moelleringii TaxID=2815325 RepID=A0ABS3LCV1_9ENTE|nr:LysR family transcriptional regulator [Enterococcus sp. 669A]MBO1307463.1 LysR family transcriptional regulator [Enterococcus sp. 669A]